MTQVDLGRDPAEERRVALDVEGQALDTALQTVEDHANPSWVLYARHVIEHVARTNATFIVDAVWEAGLGKPSEARAIGAVLVWAKRERLIEPTDDFLPSAQPGCHRVPRRVWRSLVFQEAT